MNAYLIRPCREMLAYPRADVVLGAPGHEPIDEPLAALPRKVFLSESLAKPAVSVVRRTHVSAQVVASQPQRLSAVVGRGHGLLYGEQGTATEDLARRRRVLWGHQVRVRAVGEFP